MSRSLLVLLAAPLLVVFVACAGKAPAAKNELATSGDPKKDKTAPAEGDDSTSPQGPSGQPQPAPEEGSNPAPRPDGGARTKKDAGSGGADAGVDPGDPGDPTDPPPYDPALDPSSCWSATLLAYEEPGACVQSATTQKWYQCHDTQWYQGVDGATGPYGTCTSLHPL